MKLYGELAPWFSLLEGKEAYRREASFYGRLLRPRGRDRVKTLLELGSGAGSNAFYLKRSFTMTLVDLSPAMLRESRRLNPECEHLRGDMRTLRLGRTFDAVFIHDAILHMTTERDLRRAIRTAFEHCRPGGIAVFAPDFTRETFRPGFESGGRDENSRGLRFLQWEWDPDSRDTTYSAAIAYVLRNGKTRVRVTGERMRLGLFTRAKWLELMNRAGFRGRRSFTPWRRDIFVGVRPAQREIAKGRGRG